MYIETNIRNKKVKISRGNLAFSMDNIFRHEGLSFLPYLK